MRKTLIIIFLSLAVLFGIVGIVPKLIPIRDISCSSQFGDCNNNLIGRINSIELNNYFDVKKKLREILNTSSDVNEYSIRFVFPSKFKVDVIYDEKKFAIQNKSLDSYAILSSDGEVLAILPETNLPSIETEMVLPGVGEKVDAKTLFALNIVERLNAYRIIAEMDDTQLLVTTDSGVRVIFPLVGDKDVLLGTFVLIMSRLQEMKEESRIENIESIEEIDLRFKNPVLR